MIRVDPNDARELFLEPGASVSTRTVDYNDPTVQERGSWSIVSGFYETSDWDAALSFDFVGNVDVELDMGEGSDHSLYDVYIDGTLWQSFNGYAGTAATRTIDIPLRGDGWHTLELRNRHARNLQSSGYKLRFKELRSDSALTEKTINYTYDGLSRLIEADYDNGATVYNYGYDEAGNMVNMDGTTRTYNEANQMTNDGTNTLTYDNNGNLTNDGVNSYTWDNANRLTDVGSTSYAYDGVGNRISQNALTYLLDVQPGLTLVLGDSDGNHFVHSIRGIHAVDDGTDWHFYAQDGLGSVRGLVDDAAVVQSSMSFDPYGNLMGSYGAGFGFTGEQTDANGSVFLRARYYEPNLGVFSALDPFEGVYGRPMSLNGYSWVEGNPVMNTDSTGMNCECDQFLEARDMPAYTACIAHVNQRDAESPCCGPDITQWIHREIGLHMDYARNSSDLKIAGLQDWIYLDDLYRLAVYGLAVDYGFVDYQGLAVTSAEIEGVTESKETNYDTACGTGIVSVCGRCQSSSDFGNFILGMAIESSGYSWRIADISADTFNNLFSDDISSEADLAGVRAGFWYGQLNAYNPIYSRQSFCLSLGVFDGVGWFDTIPSGCSSCSCEEPNLNYAPHSSPYWNAYVSNSLGNTSGFATPQEELKTRAAGVVGLG